MSLEQEARAKYKQLVEYKKKELSAPEQILPIAKGFVNGCKQLYCPYNFSFKITLDNGEVLYYNGLSEWVAPKLFPTGRFVAVSYKLKANGLKIIEHVFETFQ